MYRFFLAFIFSISTCLCADVADTQVHRSAYGENWKILSRGSFATGSYGITISNPGNYTLSETVTPSGVSTALIVINTDDVVLDLAGHSLNGSNVSSAGILVNGRKNITIRNGNLNSVAGFNIAITSGSSDVRLENITITNSGSAHSISIGSGHVKLSQVSIIGSSAIADGIFVATGLNDITLDSIRISNTAGNGISVGRDCYSVRMKNIEIDTCGKGSSYYGVTLGAGCYDILMDNFKLSNIEGDGIFIGEASYGITLRQGSVTNCGGFGVNILSGTHGIQLLGLVATRCSSAITGNVTSGVVVGNCTLSDSTGTTGYACKFTSSQNIIIENSNFFETTNSSSLATGLWLYGCTNVTCNNLQSGGHSGAEACGYRLESNCSSCRFTNCIASGNTATSTDPGVGCSGFYVASTNGCTFSNCTATGNQSALQGWGYKLSGSVANTFSNCKALQNFIPIGSNTALAAGFYSIGGASNKWQECEANGQNAGNVTSTSGYGAFGFYLGNEQQSSLYHCKATGNGALFNHAATSAGFYFDALLNRACVCLEIRECAANGNCTSSTSEITAYGFWDSSTATSNVFIDCYAASNSDSATPRVVTNYSATLPIGGTNFPRVEGSLDGLLDLANKPAFYNVSITS